MSRLEQVHVGMRVLDSLGEDIGVVDQIHAGAGGPTTTHGREGLPGGLARAVGSARSVHPLAATRMLRTGYVRVRRRGVVPGHAYVAGDQIRRVAGSTAQLAVTGTEMLTS